MKRISLLLLCGLAVAGTDPWFTDMKKATDAAKKAGKPLLLDFTGSDWCGYCKKLDAEVFATDEFAKWAKENVILVTVDFPRGKKLDDKLAKQNNELKEKFKINGFPTLVYLDGEGNELGRSVGYTPGTGPAKWIEDASTKLKAERSGDATEEKSPWGTDFQAACERAKKEKKPILADFTGSDWCGYCQKLDAEVFATDAFKQWAEKNVVLLTVDFPKQTKLDEAVAKQNDDLKAKFKINGFPTLVFMDGKGKELGRTTGYKPGTGPEKWIEATNKLLKIK